MQDCSVKTSVYFGSGALGRLADISDKRVLIVTDGFMASSGTADKVASHLTNCTTKVYDKVVPEPPIDVVAQGVKALEELDAEVIVALGGGSSIDAAKAIRAIYRDASGAEKAAQLIFEYLPRCHKDGSDLEAREKMSNAACLAGLAFNRAGLGVNHGAAHAIGARFHLPHGRCCQLLLPHVIAFNADLEGARNGQ